MDKNQIGFLKEWLKTAMLSSDTEALNQLLADDLIFVKQALMFWISASERILKVKLLTHASGKTRMANGRLFGDTAVQQLNTLYIFFFKKQKLAEKHSFLCKLGLLKLHNDSSLNAILQNIF
ncbi:hypothetical protein MOE00_16910 [Bacillus inaquosorum]|uniref:hypothetical protein n=1 Tax=Bacillus inaquosorum TaxID=483913 RepID=UPI00227F4774|nr:hypothetical protein [Bacillus inaquosorum]MCY8146762.1 hypothetical protein [Bacillus inaquosorum]MCY8174335.1 hypothetical protein [Bacillus inaquosorum]MCY8793930.1 hypothetical protein [Bacillus inaquosorum]MCY8798465.1 hypothetical protein [Bacillus inaquosorum]MCY8843582.1 hypothetical protein [Bacillus inaquosorum]